MPIKTARSEWRKRQEDVSCCKLLRIKEKTTDL
jgi:hypothetical protein